MREIINTKIKFREKSPPFAPSILEEALGEYFVGAVPVLLNTSFNENEPIVHRPGEALDCFLWTKMDVMVMGKSVLKKGSNEEGR